MRNTIEVGATLIIDEAAYRGSPSPARLDIIAHGTVANDGSLIVKRVVALGGEIVEIRDNQLFVDGQPLDEPYISDSRMSDFGPEFVPDGHVFVLGDNRGSSRDSRVYGPVFENDILGRVVEIQNP